MHAMPLSVPGGHGTVVTASSGGLAQAASSNVVSPANAVLRLMIAPPAASVQNPATGCQVFSGTRTHGGNDGRFSQTIVRNGRGAGRAVGRRRGCGSRAGQDFRAAEARSDSTAAEGSDARQAGRLPVPGGRMAHREPAAEEGFGGMDR